jgi:opacity protein-like surface antigen
MRKVWCVLGLVLLFGVTAFAQDNPKADVFLGYSYVRVNPGTISGVPGFNLNGGSASVNYSGGHTFGVVGEFSGYHAGNIGGVPASGTLLTYMFGPRLTYHGGSRFSPFAHALFGGARVTGSAFGGTASANSFAVAIGGGVDAKIADHVAVRLGQFDYLLTRFDVSGTGRTSQNNLRYSGGVVFRW